jgi:hypothetical protein
MNVKPRSGAGERRLILRRFAATNCEHHATAG